MPKLIRDKYVDIIAQNDYYTETDKDKLYEFKKSKLREEIDELIDCDFKDIDEFADVLEIIFNIGLDMGFSQEKLTEARLNKLIKKGGFFNGVILKTEKD